MARSIPEETIRRIKNVANIVDIIGEYVVLKKAGRNFIGLCPFHAEKTPSFSVSPEKQIFYCFGCHSGGNVYSFLMQHQGLSFPEAVRSLGNRLGIEVAQQELTPIQKKQLSEKEALFEINVQAMRYFRHCLHEPDQGQKAMSYLVARGMTRKVIEHFSLGYAPKRWDGLLRFFQRGKGSPQQLAKAGLIVPRRESSGYYDRFRDRVIFPIFNQNEQVIGFGGRVMTDEMPKYLNSPESVIFNKRRSLYGIEKATGPSRSANKVFVVEGYFDVIAMHLYGVQNSVATLGTSLTSEHVQTLKGLVGQQGQVILVFDSDQAGIKAAQRSIHVFEQGFVEARILVLPDGYDPDLYLREHGPDVFRRASEQAVGMISFLMESAIKDHGLSIEGKVKIIKALEEPLAAVQDAVARSLYIQRLAERIGVPEGAIMEQVRQTLGRSGDRISKRPSTGGAGRLESVQRLEERVVAMMLQYPEMMTDIVARGILDYFEDTGLKSTAQTVLKIFNEKEGSLPDLISAIDDPTTRNLLARLAMDEEHWDREGCERLFSQLESRYQKRMRENLQREIEIAERDHDFERLARLLRQKQEQAGKGLTDL